MTGKAKKLEEKGYVETWEELAAAQRAQRKAKCLHSQ